MKTPMLTPAESIKTCISKLFDFNGRARRSEYWWYTTAVTLAAIVVGLIIVTVDPNAFDNKTVEYIFTLAVSLLCFSVSIRRIHDSGRSGWYILCGLLPLLGTFIILLLMVADSEKTENEYGPSPKYVDDDSQLNPANDAN